MKPLNRGFFVFDALASIIINIINLCLNKASFTFFTLHLAHQVLVSKKLIWSNLMNYKVFSLSFSLLAISTVQVSALEVSATDKSNSEFVGAYSQIGVGYESNTAQSSTVNETELGVSRVETTGQNPTSDGVALVLGAGYNFQIHPKFLLGLGADWSAFNNVTSSATYVETPAESPSEDTETAKFKTSNRYSVFLTPSYVIDKNKLAYFKVGYSGQSINSMSGPNYSAKNASTYLNGYALGLGYKQIITGGLYGFGEGNFYGYSKSNRTISSAKGPETSTPDALSYTFLMGVGYVF